MFGRIFGELGYFSIGSRVFFQFLDHFCGIVGDGLSGFHTVLDVFWQVLTTFFFWGELSRQDFLDRMCLSTIFLYNIVYEFIRFESSLHCFASLSA